MYKKIIFMILIQLLFINNLYSATNDEYYNEYINKYIKKETLIINSVYRYLYSTGDYNITRNKLSNYFHYKYNVFTNLDNEKCKVVNNGEYCDNTSGGINPILNINNYTLTLQNHLNLSKINKTLLTNYENSPFLPSDFILNNNDLKIVLSPNIVKYITTIKNLEDADIYISTIKPTDNQITTWIKPINNGILTLYLKDNNNKWVNVYNLNKNQLSFDIYINKTLNINIANIKLPDNSIVTFYDKSTKKLESYIINDGEWHNLITADSFDIWAGDSQIFDVACMIFNKQSKSIANIDTSDSYITQPQTFMKYDDFGDGYWNSNNYYIIDNYNTLSNLVFKTTKGDFAYKCSDDTLKYDTLLNIFNSSNWYYLSKDYQNLSYYNTKNDNEKYVLSWNLLDSRDNDLKRLFKGDTNTKNQVIWKSEYLYNNGNPIKSQTIEISDNRDDFSNLSYDSYYLTKNSDCLTKQNCNGTDKFNHIGWKIDNMYVWLFNGTSLVDAYPIDSFQNMYEGDNSGKTAYLLNTNHKVYIKKYDINKHIVYQEKDNNTFWTIKGQEIPNQYIYNGVPSFPKKVLNDKRTSNDNDITALNATFLNKNLLLDDKIRMINWFNNLNDGIKIVISGNGGEYIWNKKGYWINNTTKEVLTGYTRNEMPIMNNNDYTYLSLNIGCSKDNLIDINKQCRYTNDGIKNNDENELYQWYIATTKKSVNNLVDVIQLNTINDLYNSNVEIGHVANTNTIYTKKMDINNNLCYKKLNDLTVILKNGETLPIRYLDVDYNSNNINNINIPNNRTCSNLKVDMDALIFNDRSELLQWTNLKENYEGKLLINNKTYLSKKNLSNRFYFESLEANEKLANDKETFDNVVFDNNNIKYITKSIGNRTLYNSGLKIGDYLNTTIKVNGTFSNNDKLLYVWYANPTSIGDSLEDVFVSNNISDIYNMKMNKIYYDSDLYGYLLLNLGMVNNEICYINQPDEDYNNWEYILKTTGKKSMTKNIFPENYNCLNSQFNNNSLIIQNMTTAINWTQAKNNFSVILESLNDKDRYYFVKHDDKAYWINDTNLNDGTILNSDEPNKIYAYNRKSIDVIPENNTDLRAYTVNIDNEETNLNLSANQTFYQWMSYKNLISDIQNTVFKINNLSEYFTTTILTDNILFNNISNVSDNNTFVSKPAIDNPFYSTYKLHLTNDINNLTCQDIAKISAATENILITSDKIWNSFINDYLNNNIVVINNVDYKVVNNDIANYDDYTTFQITLKNVTTGDFYSYNDFTYSKSNIEHLGYDINNNLIDFYFDNDTDNYFKNNNINKTTVKIINEDSNSNNCKVDFNFITFDSVYANNLLINNCQNGYIPYSLTQCYKDVYKIESNSQNTLFIDNLKNQGYLESYRIDNDNNQYMISHFDINSETNVDNINLNSYNIGTILKNNLTNQEFIILFDNFRKENTIRFIEN